MALKGTEIDSKELELETWPAFVDILSSTVVVLAFAFFILIVVQSLSRVTSSTQDQQKNSGGASEKVAQSTLLSQDSAKFEKLAIIAPPTLATNKEPEKTTSDTEADTIKFVPKDAKITDKEVKVTEPGESKIEVLGTIPKFTDTRVMEVLKELITVQQDVIAQQRKVIEQQQTEIKQATREYQSLLSLVTKNPEIEDIKQKIIPRNDQAKFIPVDTEGNQLSGTSTNPSGTSTYVLSPPNIASKTVKLSTTDNKATQIVFNDNAQYLNNTNTNLIKAELQKNIANFKVGGVELSAKPTDFAISSAEGRRIAVNRLLLIRSLLIDLGVDKTLIKFKAYNNQNNNGKEEDYGWVSVTPIQ